MNNNNTIHELDFKKSGANLRLLLNKHGISVSSVASMLDVSYQAVYRYLDGTSLPIDKVYKIAQMLGVKIDDILIPRGK